jgi:hypothetical protein
MEQKQLVSIDTMKAVEIKTAALTKLIAEMEEVEQRKIDLKIFEKVRDLIECEKCGTELVNFKYISDIETRKICSKCLADEKAQETKKRNYEELKIKWKKLEIDLNKQDEMGSATYQLVETPDKYLIGNFSIKRQFGNFNVTIYRTDLYSPSHYNHHVIGHALRIYTNNDNVNASKLQKDFGSFDVAGSLHKKCNELIKKLDRKQETEIANHTFLKETITNIVNNFPGITAGNIESDYRLDHKGRYQQLSNKIFLYNGFKISTYDGKLFSIKGIATPKSYNASNIKKIVDFRADQLKKFCDFVNSIIE